MIPAISLLLATAAPIAGINWNSLNPAQRAYSSFVQQGSVVRIATNNPVSHLSGLVMTTGNGVTGFYLDKGIFSQWRFNGSTGPDTLTFGPQGVIISKRSGGVVDFGVDRVQDTFTFTNRINVERCSKKHGFRCHPLNHLQKVLIKNFGPEDVIDLQGKKYSSSQVKNGLLPGVPGDRLRVELLKLN